MLQIRRIKPLLFILSILLIVIIGVFAWRNQAPPGRQALPYTLPDPEGRPHTLEESRGHPTLLHFWASWCEPCLEEIPALWALASKHKKLRVVAISLDESWRDARKVLDKHPPGKNVLILLDPEQTTPELYGSYQYPETYLIGPDLTILTKWVGPQPWDTPEFERALKPLLGARTSE